MKALPFIWVDFVHFHRLTSWFRRFHLLRLQGELQSLFFFSDGDVIKYLLILLLHWVQTALTHNWKGVKYNLLMKYGIKVLLEVPWGSELRNKKKTDFCFRRGIVVWSGH